MVELSVHNGWKGGEFNVILFDIARTETGIFCFAAGLFGFCFALVVTN
jgi:hypothetical protein